MPPLNSLIKFAIFVCIVTIFNGSNLVIAENLNSTDIPTVGLTPTQMIQVRKFDAVEHTITTRDGYIISVNQIINPLMSGRQLKRPVLLVHGLFESATAYLYNSDYIRPTDLTLNNSISLVNATIQELDQITGPDQHSLAFLLSNSGYNVFLINLRGNDLSRGHVNLSALSDDKYWDYSIDNHALFDVPDTIDYILKLTGAEKVGYVGHSMGGWSIMTLLSERPEYSEIIEPVVTLTQVTYNPTTYSPILRPLWEFYGRESLIVKGQYICESFPPSAKEIRAVLGSLCYRPKSNTAYRFCRTLTELIGGKGKSDKTTTVQMMSELLYTTSTKVLSHWGQLLVDKRYGKFDYGPIGNQKHYGSLLPPAYNLANIKSKSLVIHYGKTDAIATPIDIEFSLTKLSVKPYKVIYIDGDDYEHFDPLGSDYNGVYTNLPALKIFEEFQLGLASV